MSDSDEQHKVFQYRYSFLKVNDNNLNDLNNLLDDGWTVDEWGTEIIDNGIMYISMILVKNKWRESKEE